MRSRLSRLLAIGLARLRAYVARRPYKPNSNGSDGEPYQCAQEKPRAIRNEVYGVRVSLNGFIAIGGGLLRGLSPPLVFMSPLDLKFIKNMGIFNSKFVNDTLTYKSKDNVQARMNQAKNYDGENFNPYAFIDVNDYRNNKRGRAAYQEDLAELLYLGQLHAEDRMNEYNSPVEQAQRMREAGLNPDLLGVENTPAANVAGYSGNPLEGIPTTGESITNIVGVIGSTLSMATGLMNGISAFNGQRISNLAGALSNADNLMTLFDSAPAGTNMKDFIKSLPGVSSSQKRQLRNLYKSYFPSPRARKGSNDFWSAYHDSVGRFNKSSNNPYNAPIDSLTDEEWQYIWQPFIDASVQEVKDILKRGQKLDYDTQLSEELVKRAKSENSSFDTFKGSLIETFNRLDKLGEKGEFLKAALATVLMTQGIN